MREKNCPKCGSEMTVPITSTCVGFKFMCHNPECPYVGEPIIGEEDERNE